MQRFYYLLIFLSILSINVGCKNESQKESLQNLKIKSIIYIDLDEIPSKFLNDSFFAFAKKNRWERQQNILYLKVPISHAALIEADGQKIKADNNGLIAIKYLQKASDTVNAKFLKKEIYRGAVMVDYPKLTTKKGEISLFLRSSGSSKQELVFFQKYGEAPDCCSKVPHLGGGDPMEDQRCLDYNGWKADGVNRPKSDKLSYLNFIGSDCQYAMVQGNCALDHYNNGCQKNHDGIVCSELIGHSSSYHTH